MRNSISEDDLCVKVYDPRNRELIAIYENYKKAALKLGVSETLIRKKIVNKKRLYSPILDLEVAIRIGVRSKDNEELIKKR
jgi:hypothetical protein